MSLKIYTHDSKIDASYGLGEQIKTQINQLSIIPILSDSIYKDPLSAIRELYVNEVTACKKSKLNSRIEIKLDTNSRDLIIQGINSSGITREIFDKILTVMGNSSNDDNSKSGYFGLGFFSHVKISEKMLVHTYTQDEKYFSFISKSGLSFEILPNEYTEKLSNYGTKIIMNVKDVINLDELITKIKEIIQFSLVKTDFYIDEINQNIRQFQSLKEIMINDYPEFYNKKYSEISLKIHENNNELYDLIIVKDYPSISNLEDKIFLLNTPVNVSKRDLLNRYNIDIYLNIKNEHFFKPHVSRDYLTKESEVKLKNLLLKDLEIFDEDRNYNDIEKNKIDIMDYVNDNNRFLKYYQINSIKVKNFFNQNTKSFEDSLIDIFKYIKNDYVIKGICFLEYYNLKIMKDLFNLGYICFSYSRSQYDTTRANEYFFNISDVQEILKANNIKSKVGLLKSNNSNSHVFTKTSDPKYVFKVIHPRTKKFEEFYNIGFTYLDSKKPNHLGVYQIENILKDEIFFTNEGYKTLSELENFDLIKVDYIFHNYLDSYNQNDKYCFIDDNLKISLLSLYFDKGFRKLNVISNYITNYNFENVNLKKLIFDDIINLWYVKTYDQMKILMDIENDH